MPKSSPVSCCAFRVVWVRLVAVWAVLLSSSPARAQRAIWIWDGEGVGDNFGIVGAAGDVNGDGAADILVGAPSNSTDTLRGGRAYVYSGASGTLLYRFASSEDLENVGISVAGIGDLDGDGRDEIAIGASGADNAIALDMGRADVWSGSSSVLSLLGEGRRNLFGNSVSAAGDVDGDGVPDFIVGAMLWQEFSPNFQKGRGYVYSGATGSVLHTFTGQTEGDLFGVSVCGAGDVNADGFADVIVGAMLDSVVASREGRGFVYSGVDGSLLYQLDGQFAFEGFGFSCDGVGDVNLDGYDDFLIGSATSVTPGHSYLYSGRDGSVLYHDVGERDGDRFGQSVAGAGDVNGDGYPDYLISAADAGPNQRGRVYLYSGRFGRLLYRWTGGRARRQFGWSVAGVGDVDGDQLADIAVGDITFNGTGPDAGRAYVYAGNDLFLQAQPGSVGVGETLRLRTRGGEPGNVAGLLLVSVNGLPANVLVDIGVLDAVGEWTVSGVAPPSFAGLQSIDVVALSGAGTGTLADSELVRVGIH